MRHRTPHTAAVSVLVLALACAQAPTPPIDPAEPAMPTADEIDAALRVPNLHTVPGTKGTLPASQGWHDDPEPDRALLRQELEAAKAQVEDSELRVGEADARYSRGRHNRARGSRRVELMDERVAAKKAYAEARANYDEVKSRANRWGVFD